MNEMIYCKKCVMPSTRPGLVIDENGVCSACNNYEKQKLTDWGQRKKELDELCDKHRRKDGYDCIIACSSGKDSHSQVLIMKELQGMNPLLVTVEDNFIMSEAGKHNLVNISERFGCHIISLKPNIKAQKLAMRYTFEKYGKPTQYLDNLIYNFPLYVAKQFGIGLVVYGEDVSFVYGGVDAKEKPSALNQVNNGVATQFPKHEFLALGIPEGDLGFFDPPELNGQVNSIYLSYYIQWNSYRNYITARNNGLKDLRGEHTRTNQVEQFDQVDSFAYMIHPALKYPRLGHGGAWDYCSRFIRYGMMTREEAVKLINSMDHTPDNRMIDDFCKFLNMSRSEFWTIYNSHFNMDLFYKNEAGEFELKNKLA